MNASSAHVGFRSRLHATAEHMNPDCDADIGRRLVRSFDRAVAERSEGAMNALREDAIALATAIRATALPPERAVILLKTMLRAHRSAGWAPSIAAARETAEVYPESLIYGTMFAWWVSAYYGEASADPGPRPTADQARLPNAPPLLPPRSSPAAPSAP